MLPPASRSLGDSAGGGLAIATLVALRDEGEPLPGSAAILSPLTDLAAEGSSHDENADRDPVVNRELTVGMGEVYLGGLPPKQTPLGSPLYADLHGLPPLLAMASQHETLRDDTVRVVEKVEASGGTAELVLFDDVPHVWGLFPFLEESAEALRRIAEFVASKVSR